MNTDRQLKVLTARKGCEYSLDDLRLTMFGAEPVYEPIKQAFHFQAHGLVSPPPTFGPVVQTLPPGLVFQVGWWATESHQIVPIRFMHIEPTRIVIDVAGPSGAAQAVYEALLAVISDMAAPDGSPLIGTPARVLNFSEVSMSVAGTLNALFTPAAHDLFTHAAQDVVGDVAATLMPSIQFQAVPMGVAFDGQVNIGDGRTFSLSVRAGSTPNDHIIYSSAPLETEQHVDFLQSLSALLV